MNYQPNQEPVQAHVELEAFPPQGYVIIKAVASDGVLVAKMLIHEAIDNPEGRQFRTDRLWNAIHEYETRVLGKRLTPVRPRAALSLMD